MNIIDWLGSDNQLGQDIWEKKYRYNNETFDEWLDRVSGNNKELRKIIEEKKFLFGGRSLANRGTNKKGSYFNCFVAGTKVITEKGLVNIEDVKVGDKVISEDGNFHLVNDVMERNYEGDLYKISSSSLFDDILCTPNHRFLTNNGWKRADRLEALPMRINCPDKLRIPECTITKKYVDIDLIDYLKLNDNQRYEINDGFVQVFTKFKNCKNSEKEMECHRQNKFKRYLSLDDDMMYFIGRFLGDGSVTLKSEEPGHKSTASVLQIVFNAKKEKKDADRIIKIGAEHFGIQPNVRETNQNIISVRWNSETICNFFYEEFGRGCSGKSVPDKYIGDLNIACGLLDSDGYMGSHGNMKIVLKNNNLMKWLQETLFLNGIPCGKIHDISYRQADTYQINLSTYLVKNKLFDKLSKTCYDKVRNIGTDKVLKDHIKIDNIDIVENISTKVYNLSVEDVHSYTANGVVVHNCYSNGYCPDDIEEIMKCNTELALTYKAQGGQGVSLTKIRPKGTPIGTEFESDGIVPFMEMFNTTTSSISQGGARKGALMMSIDIRHKEAPTFITIKSNEDKITKANLSLEIDDEFMEAVQTYYMSGQEVILHEKRDYNGHIVEYDISPIKLYKLMIDTVYDWGEPGCIFTNRFRNYNLMQFDDDYEIVTCNPCKPHCRA